MRYKATDFPANLFAKELIFKLLQMM
ncbi:MAG: hypothetical protein ACI8VI_001373, partial [Granulosicoccus sp.]